MHTKTSTGKIPQTYEFIKAHRKRFNARTMRRVFGVAPSGYSAWLQVPTKMTELLRKSDNIALLHV